MSSPRRLCTPRKRARRSSLAKDLVAKENERDFDEDAEETDEWQVAVVRGKELKTEAKLWTKFSSATIMDAERAVGIREKVGSSASLFLRN